MTSIGIKKRTRKVVSVSRSEMVKTHLMEPHGAPLVIEPAMAGVDLAAWAKDHRQQLEGWLGEHRALLMRGFEIGTLEAFQAVVAASSSGEPLQYKDRSTPRFEVGSGVYVSTIYPPEQRIKLHNEGTYWQAWALKIYFCCLVPSTTGGETPICDVRKVFEAIDPQIREEFERRKIMYVRNYNHGVGLTWQEAYQASEPSEVESYLRGNGIEWEWGEEGRLRTRQIRPAVRIHPTGGEKVWFNHGAFFHISSQEPEVRAQLLSSFGVENLPYNTYYGDGEPIDDEVIAHIHRAYQQNTLKFLWQQGDVLLLDNMTFAHGRESYTGDRNVVVAMVEKQTDLPAA